MTSITLRQIRSNQNWLLSYTDLFLLVLSFFIMRFSILKYDLNLLDSLIPPSNLKSEANYFDQATLINSKNVSISDENILSTEWINETDLSYRGKAQFSKLSQAISSSSKVGILKVSHNTIEDSTKLTELISLLKSAGLSSLTLSVDVNMNSKCSGRVLGEKEACFILEY